MHDTLFLPILQFSSLIVRLEERPLVRSVIFRLALIKALCHQCHEFASVLREVQYCLVPDTCSFEEGQHQKASRLPYKIWLNM